MLEEIKKLLRITGTDHDDEINGLIDEAKADLELAGVKVLIDDNNIKRAIRVYCKANFGIENPDRDALNKSYEMIKGHLNKTVELGS